MKHKVIPVFLCASVLFVILACWFLIWGNNKLKEVKIGKISFKAEEVSSPDEIRKGLGGRNGICEKCAMLFVFPKEERWEFWMEDMRFDLDVIWIKNGKIADIYKNVSRESKDIMRPLSACDKALEINSGLAEKYGFKIGDDVAVR